MRYSILASLFVIACGPSVSALEDNTDAAQQTDAGKVATTQIYSHSSTALYTVDPDTLVLTKVGDFDTPETMADIAVDKDGNVFGLSHEQIFRINNETAAVDKLGNLDGSVSYNGMSFVPNPDNDEEEVLVAVSAGGEVSIIDPQTGSARVVGSYGSNIGSSGDIVYVQGFGTVATVFQNGVSRTALASIDPITFRATIIGVTNHTGIWGIGFWGDTVYGFTSIGEIIGIDPETGSSWEIQKNNEKWYGAGVTTRALVID